MTDKNWWKEAIVYQIYPRSFKDSNGDGVGDLRGILSKLDYLKDLGVTAIWINPVYVSPNEDGGYDISDYCNIQPEFGTLDDFDDLVKGIRERGLHLIMDLVLNHSSDEHKWFIESRKSKNNPYRDYYFWKPGRVDGPPNNWPSFFGGSAWQLDEITGEYYLHLFSKKQPDLNWENQELRKELKELMKFWLDRGVDGLRLDVISAISKLVEFPDTDTADFNETIRRYYANGPRIREFVSEMNADVWSKYDCMTVGEGPGITPSTADIYLNGNDGLDMIFHFGHMFIDQGTGGRFDPVKWSMKDFKSVFQVWDDALKDKGWGSIFLGNHDFARMVSRWGNDKEYWKESAKLLATLLLSMRGTPFIFQGDEIGMTNIELTSVSESQDIETKNGWTDAKKHGLSESEFIRIANYAGRDNARTPIQWDDSRTAGFTSGAPWMKINPNSKKINVSGQLADSQSVLNYFRSMIDCRKKHLVLVYGTYSAFETDDENLFVYTRSLGKEKWLIVLNFSSHNSNFPEMELFKNRKKVIGNYNEESTIIRPWEASVYTL